MDYEPMSLGYGTHACATRLKRYVNIRGPGLGGCKAALHVCKFACMIWHDVICQANSARRQVNVYHPHEAEIGNFFHSRGASSNTTPRTGSCNNLSDNKKICFPVHTQGFSGNHEDDSR